MIRLAGLAATGAAVVLLWTAVATADASSAGPGARPAGGQAGSTRLLDVPFLTQTEDLCGGAAVAMVMRYWGEPQVYPDDFATLIDRSASGIPTDVLTEDVRRRRWRASELDTAQDANAVVASHVERGRPIVALVEVRANRYHYVVIVAWTGEQVIVHDPAQAPFRVMTLAAFDHAWAAAGRWALLIVPGVEPAEVPSPPPEASSIDGPPGGTRCGPLITALVEQARSGDLAGAERGLRAAGRLCPDLPAVSRELAGIRFLQSRWREAAVFAERAAELDPSDGPGWDLLATSRFLNDEPDQALGAWNRIGRPSVDLIRVSGVGRTRHPVVVGMIGLSPRTLLTPERLGHAQRRLGELPSAAATRLGYQPIDRGTAQVEATVVERSTLPRGLVPLASVAFRMAVQRELRLDVAAPTGSGELWTVAWRRWDAGPRLAFTLALPSVGWLPGVTTVEGLWAQSRYGSPGAGAPDDAVVSNPRRRAAVGLADWATRRLRWHAALALDRWAADSYASVGGGLDRYLVHDHLSVGVDAATWMPTASGRGFATAGASYSVRSTRDVVQPSWTLQGEFTVATRGAPLDVWPGAGEGRDRPQLLRAHPLLRDGVLRGPVFGRRLAHTTLEYQHPLLRLLAGSVRVAAFADIARAWERADSERRAPWHADIGAGVRVRLPGQGALRADIARGLRDRNVVVSAGWLAPWPGR